MQMLLQRLQDPKEKDALVLLTIFAIPIWLCIAVWVVVGFGLPLLIIGAILLARHFAELYFTAYIKANAVQVSQSQLPEVYDVLKKCCDRLETPILDLYILQDGVWNAFAMKAAGKRVVVLLSGAVDSILLKGDMGQLAWLIGHEIGHHYAGHFGFWRKVAEFGGWIPVLILWYKRRCELTCDRIGLYCSESLEASYLALANAAVGAQLASKVDIDEAIAQWQRHSNEFFVQIRTLYATHPHHLARLAELRTAARIIGIKPREVDLSFMASDTIDSSTLSI